MRKSFLMRMRIYITYNGRRPIANNKIEKKKLNRLSIPTPTYLYYVM